MTQQNQETVTKQKNPLRVEQGRKLVEYNKHKKEELKRLNEQITKQDNIADHKPRPHTHAYIYVSGLSVLGLAITTGWKTCEKPVIYFHRFFTCISHVKTCGINF